MATSYNRDEVVAEVRLYYEFLITLFLDEDAVVYPPEGGWPTITHESFAWLGKTDRAVDLLRHLPYIRRDLDSEPYQLYESTTGVDYRGEFYDDARRWQSASSLDPAGFLTTLPDYVITLATTPGGRNGNYFLIDTERGTASICDFQVGPSMTELSEEVPEDSEDKWRQYEAYSIPDFFALLKSRFRDLEVYPLTKRQVRRSHKHTEWAFPGIQEMFHTYGWCTDGFRKDACINKITATYEALDAVFHPLFAASSDSGHLKDPMVPVFIDELYVSSEIPTNMGEDIDVYCSTSQKDHRHVSANLICTNSSKSAASIPVLKISGLTCIALARDVGTSDEQKVHKMAYSMNWDVDVDFMTGYDSKTNKAPPEDLIINYMTRISHKTPQARILFLQGPAYTETILKIVQALSDVEGKARVGKMQIAGSSDAFEQADDFAAWTSVIEYKNLDINLDISSQGLEASSYDVILDLKSVNVDGISEQTRKNISSLLKSTGRFVSAGPVIDLGDHSFALTDMGPFHVARPRKQRMDSPQSVVLIHRNGLNDDYVQQLMTGLQERNVSVSTSGFPAFELSGKVCIFLPDSDNYDLANPTSESFESIKQACLESAGVLWLTRGAYSGAPLSNMITGLMRTVRSESGQVPMVTLDVESFALPAQSDTVANILRIYEDSFLFKVGPIDHIESEYRESNGHIFIPRLVEDNQTNTAVHTINSEAIPELMPFNQPGRPLRIDIGSPGLLDSLYFVDDEEMTQELSADCVEVEVMATGFNFRDVMMTLGQITIDALGGELGGVVKAVGKAVTTLAVGDRVAGCHLGTFRNFARPNALLMKKIPDDMSFQTSAALPVVYCTAYHSLFNIARLRKGETVLIHAASGGVGQAAIELCHLVGAEPFVTVGTLEKKTMLIQNFGVKPENIFYSRDGSFAKSIISATDGKGVDVILNSLAGEALRLTWSCIAPYGRFIELGKRDFFVNSRLDMAKFAKNVTFAAVDLVSLIRDKPDLVSEVWGSIMELIFEGSLKPPAPITTYPMAKIHEALSIMQSGKHTGKLVAVPDSKDVVLAIPKTEDKNFLRSDASYVLVGGLGGIGRAMALWMTEHGAKNLIFINRSGMAKKEARDTVTVLQGRNINVTVLSCDVTDAVKLAECIESVPKTAPIKGVIQSAMVLRDVMLEKMTLDDWNTGIRPKVHGTLNLHACLPKSLDFFIMLSSVSGIIGNASQSNYAAANTFMDAFAAYRHKQGLKATSLDLGVILSVGHVAEDTELAKGMERQGFEGTKKEELMALIQSAIIGRNASSQVITGLGSYKPATAIGSISTSPLFSEYRRMFASLAAANSEDKDSVRGELKSCKNMEDAVQIILGVLLEKMAGLCMVAEDTINASKPMSEYGLDSLVAVELRNWIFKQLDCTIPILELLANISITKVAYKIAEKSRLVEIEGR